MNPPDPATTVSCYSSNSFSPLSYSEPNPISSLNTSAYTSRRTFPIIIGKCTINFFNINIIKYQSEFNFSSCLNRAPKEVHTLHSERMSFKSLLLLYRFSALPARSISSNVLWRHWAVSSTPC